MKIRRSVKAFNPEDIDFLWHIFLYSYPGAGKTKWFRDMKEAGFFPLVVATYEQDLSLMGTNIPIITVERPEELQAIITKPKNVIEQVLWPELGEEYPADLICFDVLKDLQMLLFGEAKRTKDTEVFDGRVVLEKGPGFGVMSEPNARDAAGVPSTKDYRLLDIQTRATVKKIEKMPYHTVTTAHAELNFDARTVAKLTGDQKKDKETKAKAVIRGFPSLEGYSAKADIPGLISDFMLYMDTPDQESFYFYPKPSKGFYARTRLAEFMPKVVDWTGKNGYHTLVDTVKRGMERKKKK